MRSCKILHLLCVFLSVYVCITCPQACSLSSCHPDRLDGQAKHFCHTASPSPARPPPPPFCQSAFQHPVTSLHLTQLQSFLPTSLHTLRAHSITGSCSHLDESREVSHSAEIATRQASSLTCRNQSKVWHFHRYDELLTGCSAQVPPTNMTL